MRTSAGSARARVVLPASLLLTIALTVIAPRVVGGREPQVNSSPTAGPATTDRPCVPTKAVPAAFLECRNWITFAPPRPFDPTQDVFPSVEQLRGSLTLLHQQGWRGIVTYSLDRTLAEVPRLAKEVGFAAVVAGIHWYDDAQLSRELDAVSAVNPFVDGFVLGNEGILEKRYNRERLEAEMARLKARTGKPVATTEPAGVYLADRTLLKLGDWVFPSIHPWFASINDPSAGAEFVRAEMSRLRQVTASGRLVIAKEAWWPTGGGAGASEANQVQFFRSLAATDVAFIWGEAFDQFYKRTEGPGVNGQHWGLTSASSQPKRVVIELEPIYTGRYP